MPGTDVVSQELDEVMSPPQAEEVEEESNSPGEEARRPSRKASIDLTMEGATIQQSGGSVPARAPPQRRQQPQREEDPRTLAEVYDRLVMGIIRPPRMSYDYPRALGPEILVLPAGGSARRTDFEVMVKRGWKLQCSLWKPDELEARDWPCVVYLHGNSSSRVEAVKTSVLKAAITAEFALCALDFAGCGNSEGELISLGWYEHLDLADVVNELRRQGAGRIVLWGRSMGAVTALMYAANSSDAEPPSGLVLDSPFSSFKQLAYDLTSKGMIRIPRFLASIVLSAIRRSVRQRAGFDLFNLKPAKRARLCKCPALFFVAEGDELIPPWHGEAIQHAYGGPSTGVRFDGTHNTARPPIVYALACVFMTAVARRSRHPVQLALNLIEKTSVVTCQEDEEAGHVPRHAYRYDSVDPTFVRAGSHSVMHITAASNALVSALDMTLACRAAEEYMADELIAGAVAYVYTQLRGAQEGVLPEEELLMDEVLRVVEDHARSILSSAKPDSSTYGLSGWENMITRDVGKADVLEQSRLIVDGLRDLRRAMPTRSRDVSGAPPSSVSALREPELAVAAVRPKAGVARVKLCCFDMADLMQAQEKPSSRQDCLAEVAAEFFEDGLGLSPMSQQSPPTSDGVEVRSAAEVRWKSLEISRKDSGTV